MTSEFDMWFEKERQKVEKACKKTYLAKNQSPPDYGISLKTLFILPIALILLVIDWLRS